MDKNTTNDTQRVVFTSVVATSLQSMFAFQSKLQKLLFAQKASFYLIAPVFQILRLAYRAGNRFCSTFLYKQLKTVYCSYFRNPHWI